jgi:hypothetical protein
VGSAVHGEPLEQSGLGGGRRGSGCRGMAVGWLGLSQGYNVGEPLGRRMPGRLLRRKGWARDGLKMCDRLFLRRGNCCEDNSAVSTTTMYMSSCRQPAARLCARAPLSNTSARSQRLQ